MLAAQPYVLKLLRKESVWGLEALQLLLLDKEFPLFLFEKKLHILTVLERIRA